MESQTHGVPTLVFDESPATSALFLLQSKGNELETHHPTFYCNQLLADLETEKMSDLGIWIYDYPH